MFLMFANPCKGTNIVLKFAAEKKVQIKNIMKYIVRALKYFVHLTVLLALLIVILALMGLVPGDIDRIFINGTQSIGQMALIVALFAIVYPRLGYTTRNVYIKGSSEEIEPRLDGFMRSRHYVLVKKDEDKLLYRKASVPERILKMGEDTVTFTRVINGYALEGSTKDVVRLDTGLTQFFESEQ